MAATYVCPTCLTPVSIEGRAREGVLQHECPKHGWVSPVAAFRCSSEGVEESGGVGEHLAESRAMEQWKEEKDGYDLTDPKHPDFHSVHADIWDAREGK